MQLSKRQDVIWIDYEPHKGHETGGHDPEHDNIRRPMIVINDTNYIQANGLVIGMPTTHQDHYDDSIHKNYIKKNIRISVTRILGYLDKLGILCSFVVPKSSLTKKVILIDKIC